VLATDLVGQGHGFEGRSAWARAKPAGLRPDHGDGVVWPIEEEPATAGIGAICALGGDLESHTLLPVGGVPESDGISYAVG